MRRSSLLWSALILTTLMLASGDAPAGGDIAILDNLSSHKVEGVQQAIAAAGARVLYLPPYSPDLNPIEKLFSKLKTLLRKAAKRSTKNYGRKSANCSTPSLPANVQTTSPLLDM